MIKRYSVKKITDIFSDSNKYKNWLKIEVLLIRYLAKKQFLSLEKAERLIEDLTVLPHKVREEEKRVNHDVVAFINQISSSTSLPERKWIHYGLTSSDIVDTGNSMALKEVNEIILENLNQLIRKIGKLAIKHKDTYKLRRHNLKIEGLESFGCNLAQIYSDLKVALNHFLEIRKHVEVVSLSGSVGHCKYLDPDLQDYVARELGLFSSRGSTQVLSRSRYYSYFAILNSIAQIINSFAIELRLLCRTEIGEVSEGFEKLQIGSSSMPHKRNPITLENICGLFRLFGGYLKTSEDNSVIWFERDLSHSSADRVLFLDGITVFVQILNRMNSFLNNFSVNEEVMRANIEKHAFKAFEGYMRDFLKTRSQLFDVEIDNCFEEMKKHTSSISTLKRSFKDVGFGKKFKDYEIDKLFDIKKYFETSELMYEDIFGDQYMRFDFHNIYFENFEIKRSLDLIAQQLNNLYSNSADPVQIIGIKDDCIVFLSHLQLRLKFPVLIRTVDLNLFKHEVKEDPKKTTEVKFWFNKELLKNKRVLVLDCLFDSREVIDLMKTNLEKCGCKDINFCSMFVTQKLEISGLVDYYGLVLPNGNNVAGFGLSYSGLYRNANFVGRVKEFQS